ncbi:MAG: hypothetical protein UX09_C0051G0010 [Candidatus Uhrbacteria bacterium GW2011_GWE2_45_35]|uniref:Uncharacterized protein n=2 Tax=Candidatus Uhriibacteriota TaxID=1752732 RepID=A0A0G1LJS6_9BACT|nr:MAG: hypothetical protein UW63_C0063G0003 [Candidatus Uhrbacteria bacterium GW2011_GWF2_44_350]KKU06477.1 MAG: hypothetical protein UX09_C0051G0010 [Candidatus Uhrbacteria bacterium GW2011_GWE2_45_35]
MFGNDLPNHTEREEAGEHGEVAKLIEPDRGDQPEACLESVDGHVGQEDDDHGCRTQEEVHRQAREKNKGRGVGGAMRQHGVPVFAFFQTHPGGLPGKVTDEVGGQNENRRTETDDETGGHDSPRGAGLTTDQTLSTFNITSATKTAQR